MEFNNPAGSIGGPGIWESIETRQRIGLQRQPGSKRHPRKDQRTRRIRQPNKRMMIDGGTSRTGHGQANVRWSSKTELVKKTLR